MYIISASFRRHFCPRERIGIPRLPPSRTLRSLYFPRPPRHPARQWTFPVAPRLKTSHSKETYIRKQEGTTLRSLRTTRPVPS